jgi:AraC family transcriptional regulator
MKKETKHERTAMVNKALNYIYQYIDTPINLDELARMNSVSKYHFHRIFKEESGENLFDRISSVRLQKACSLLITNKFSTISEIAHKCGYSSHSSFIKAFKKRFGFTPTAWRKGDFMNYTQDLLHLKSLDFSKFEHITPAIEISQKKYCAYIRHKGYNESIIQTWQRLMAFAYERDILNAPQLGLLHDNPVLTPHAKCHYIAALEVHEGFQSSNSISIDVLPQNLCAVFSYEGVYGEVMELLAYIYHHWLPKSGYENLTQPSHVVYEKNQFLNEQRIFKGKVYIPICVV